jgi:CO/xanthine dehydrogenase Mo-binding subunit
MCALMAAEVLGVPVDQVTVLAGDTEATPYEKGTGAAETTYRVGNIVRQAAEDARERLLEMAGERLEVDEEELDLRDGTVYVRSDPARSVTIAQLAQRAISSLAGAIIGRSGKDPEEGAAVDFVDAPCLAVHVAQIAVDAESGLIEVQRYYTAQDVGRALNRLQCEGQIQGGISWGLGYALSEELLAENGVTLNANLWEYLLTTAPHIPRIDFDMIEIPSTRGPFGAKGVGETSNLAVAPAIANAVADALGVRVTQIPLTPERVAKAVRAQRPELPAYESQR